MLTQYFQPEPNIRGLPLAKALVNRGHQVEVLTGFPNYPGGKLYDGYSLRLWMREELDGIQVVRVPLFPSHNRSSFQRIFNYLSFGLATLIVGPWLIKRPDVILVYNLITLGPTFRVISWRSGAKVVLDVLDLWPESVTASGMLRSSLAMNFLSRWCNRVYQRADRLIVCTPGFKKNLEARGIDETKIDVIYNWCDESALSIPEPDAKAAQELGFANHFNIVFAGTMGLMQSLDTVIEAASLVQHHCPDVKFTFVGGGIDVEKLKSKATALANVQFLPHLPMSEIGRVIANADVLLVHLKNERIFDITIPSKIQAYMYAGKPILCGVRGDAAGLVRNSGAGITFEPQDVESLVNAIRKIRSLPSSELRTMGLSGRAYYQQQLSFPIGVDQVEAVFKKVALRA